MAGDNKKDPKKAATGDGGEPDAKDPEARPKFGTPEGRELSAGLAGAPVPGDELDDDDDMPRGEELLLKAAEALLQIADALPMQCRTDAGELRHMSKRLHLQATRVKAFNYDARGRGTPPAGNR